MTLLILFLGAAFAADDDAMKVKPTFDLWVAGDRTTPFAANRDGILGGQDGHIHGRQLAGLSLENDTIVVRTEVGFTENLLYGEDWQIDGSIDERHPSLDSQTQIALRKLSISTQLPVAQIETGLVTSHWGLGMIANDGAHDPYFGTTEFGDRVVRARITTKPDADGPWYLTLAADRVLQDELTIDPRRQWTQQNILSLLWKEEAKSAGVYGVVRRQEEMDAQRITKVGVLDGFADITQSIGEGIEVRVAAEVAAISGKTNRTTSYNSPKRLNIRSFGATGVTMLSNDWMGVGGGFGYASGDGDPSDDELNDFNFDRNYGVGMVLFDEVMGAIESATYLDVTNPKHAGTPPSGVEASVTEGAFRRASYLQPRLEFSPYPWLEVRGGLLLAWSTAPISQPFYTVRNGGVPVNQLDRETSGYALGNEIDWAIKVSPFNAALQESISHTASVSLQGGHAQLSENLGGEAVNRYILMLRLN